MSTITHSQRYLPHELTTRYNAVKLYRTGVGVKFVCRRYHISKSSLMRWNKRYDGTKDSLRDKSHRPHSKHPNAHTPTEIAWIRSYFRFFYFFAKLASHRLQMYIRASNIRQGMLYYLKRARGMRNECSDIDIAASGGNILKFCLEFNDYAWTLLTLSLLIKTRYTEWALSDSLI